MTHPHKREAANAVAEVTGSLKTFASILPGSGENPLSRLGRGEIA